MRCDGTRVCMARMLALHNTHSVDSSTRPSKAPPSTLPSRFPCKFLCPHTHPSHAQTHTENNQCRTHRRVRRSLAANSPLGRTSSSFLARLLQTAERNATFNLCSGPQTYLTQHYHGNLATSNKHTLTSLFSLTSGKNCRIHFK